MNKNLTKYRAECDKCGNIQDAKLSKCQVCNEDMVLAKIIIDKKFSENKENEQISLLKEKGFAYHKQAIIAICVCCAVLYLVISLIFIVSFLVAGKMKVLDLIGVLIAFAALFGVLTLYSISKFKPTPFNIRQLIQKGEFEKAFNIAIEKTKSSKAFKLNYEISIVCLGYYLKKEIDFEKKIKKINNLYEKKSVFVACNDLIKEISNDLGIEYCQSFYK